MSEQDRIAFEKFVKSRFDWISQDNKDFIELGWQAATKEANKQIAALEGEVAELKAEKVRYDQIVNYLKTEIAEELGQRILELQANNNDLLDLVSEASRNFSSANPFWDKLNDAVKTTPGYSLARHDDEVIERCAKKLEELIEYRSVIDAIRALKVEHG